MRRASGPQQMRPSCRPSSRLPRTRRRRPLRPRCRRRRRRRRPSSTRSRCRPLRRPPPRPGRHRRWLPLMTCGTATERRRAEREKIRMIRATTPNSAAGGDATSARPEITSANATGATGLRRGRARPAKNATRAGALTARTLTTRIPARTRRRRPAPHRCRRATLTVTACPTPTRAHMLALIRCIALSLPPFHTGH